MVYYTKQEARRAAQSSVRKSYKAYNAQGRLTESLESMSKATRFDVFLSHSIDDAELVLGVKELLEEEGLTVYVDWDTDKHLARDKVNKETAQLLRTRLRQSNSLIYIATDNSSNSKWMPWELGFFDGYKPEGVAILPLLDHENQMFTGQEYLSLYPVVSKGKYNDGREDVFVKKTEAWKNLKGFSKGTMGWRAYS